LSIKIKSVYSLLIPISAILIPLYFTDFRFHAGGLILRASDFFAFLLIFTFFTCQRFNVITLRLPTGFKFLLLFITFCLVNGFFQSGMNKALIATFQWVFILMTISIIYSCSFINQRLFLDIFIKALLVLCLLSIIYHFSIGKFFHYKNLGDGKYVFGITGVMILTYLFFWFDKFYVFAVFLLYPFIILSLERKGILAFHVVLLIYFFSSFKFSIKILLLIFFLSVIFLSLIYPNYILDYDFRFFQYDDIEIDYLDEEQALWISNLHRQSLLINGWDIFTHNTVFGVGPKMLPIPMRNYYSNSELALYTHNVFLDTLIEQGVVGFLLLMSPYCIFLSKVKYMQRKQLTSFFALLTYSFIMLFFMSGGGPSMYLLYFPLFMNHLFDTRRSI
jgi:hypothetical protein